ncbi:MAG TPA: hypothetical protein VEI97_09115 [bacterium]|nr:hypothetical protein [bacterium]
MPADALPPSWTEYGALGLVALTLLSAVLWMLRHVITVTIPKLQEQHQTVLMQALSTFSQEQKEARAMFRAEIEAERSISERQHRENQEAAQDRQEAILAALKDTRHAVQNIDQRVTTHTALVDQALGLSSLKVMPKPVGAQQ